MLFFHQRSRLVHWAITRSVPLLNLVRRVARWPPLDELATYPEGSFGHSVSDFLAARGLEFLPQYEAHDAVHVLLGYDTDTRGELQLQAFMWANGNPSVAGRALFIIGAAALPEYWPPMRRAFARGGESARLDPDSLQRLLRTPTQQVRQITL